MSKHLSNTERLRILEEYLGDSSSKYAIQKKYGLSSGCIRFWLRKFGLSDKPQIQSFMQPNSQQESTLSVNEQEELAQLRKENRTLKAQLKHEQMGHLAYKTLVDLAEETYGVEIRKNFEAK